MKLAKKPSKPAVASVQTPKKDEEAKSAGFDSTIEKSHYTPQGEHPEDRIHRDREYIHRLRRHLDEVYDALERDLRIKEDENWLFDFIYNEDRLIEFEDYLDEYGVRYKDIVRAGKRARSN